MTAIAIGFVAGAIVMGIVGFFHAETVGQRERHLGYLQGEKDTDYQWKNTSVENGIAHWTVNQKTGQASWNWKYDVLKAIKEGATKEKPCDS